MQISITQKQINAIDFGIEQIREALEGAYCRFCEGENIAHDCDEDCYADEFSEGFIAGWDACLKYLASLPLDEAANRIVYHETEISDNPTSKK